MLEVRQVTKSFFAGAQAVPALCGVDIDVPRGGLTAILGPSGCGKTTLLRILAGLERPDAGEVRLDGTLLDGAGTHVAPERRGIGIVPQEGALFPHLSVAANIAFGLGDGWARVWSRPARRARQERVAELLDLVGLAGHERRRPHELSGGQQQRVALARALAPRPAIVLLDEPFSAIDAALRAQLRNEVRDLLRALGMTAVLVTHDQGEALSLADHLVVMRNGRVLRAGTPRDVYLSPGDPETAAFLGDALLLPCSFDTTGPPSASTAQCALGSVTVRSEDVGRVVLGGEAACCSVLLRPEQLEIAEPGRRAVVVAVHFFGHDAVVGLRLCDDETALPLLVRTRAEGLPAVGDVVGVRVAAGAVAALLA